MTRHTELPEGFIPSRHGANRKGARQMLGLVSRLIPNAEPSPARWQAMGEALMQGDEPMDDLLAWMTTQGMQRTRVPFEQALENGIDSVTRPDAPLRELFARVDTQPEWLDWGQIDLAAQVHNRAGIDGVYVGRDVALIGGYQASAFNKTLLLTGALEKGPTRRFAETLQWAMNTTADNGMRRDGEGFKSTLRVRLIHALVRRHVRQLPQWRMAEWGLPVNQTDMAATLLGALIVPIIGAQVLGMPLTRRERDAVAHHARYAGWLIGVEEQWLPQTFGEATTLLYQFLLSISNPDETSIQLARPLANEPLDRPYRNLGWLRGRINRAKHLSLSRAFLGRRGMRNLGLPTGVIPWYPALAIPKNLAQHTRSWIVPGGKARQAHIGRAQQQAFLDEMTGSDAARIGDAAAHLATHGS